MRHWPVRSPWMQPPAPKRSPPVLREPLAADELKHHGPAPELDDAAAGLSDPTPIEPPVAPLSPHGPLARARAGRRRRAGRR